MAHIDETLFHTEINPAPKSVFRQELITWEKTDCGLIRKSLTRCFQSDRHYDSYVSEPMPGSGAPKEDTANGQVENIAPSDLKFLRRLLEHHLNGGLRYPAGIALYTLRKRYPQNYQLLLDELGAS